jgi:hypothetical protein
MLKSVNFQSLDTLISFDADSLVTNIPLEQGLQVSGNKLHNDHTLAEQSILQIKTTMEWLEICLRTICFQVDNNFFQQKDGMATECSLSPIVSHSFMEHFEKVALESVQYRRLLWV